MAESIPEPKIYSLHWYAVSQNYEYAGKQWNEKLDTTVFHWSAEMYLARTHIY